MRGELFREADVTAVEGRRRQYQNGDETHVLVLDLADAVFVVLVLEFDVDGEVLGCEAIETALTETEAVERAERWISEHPRGLEDQEESGGLSSIFGG